MIELDSLLDSKFTAMAKDNVLGRLSGCGLTVEEDAFKNIKSIPNDSFFRNFIPYFPQFKWQEPGVAAHNIHKLLCAFMAAEGDNFSQVIFLLFSEDLLFRCRDDKHLLLFVKLVVINYYFNYITGAKVDTCHKCKNKNGKYIDSFFQIVIRFLQDWITAYQEECGDDTGNFYTWMTTTSKSNNPIDGCTVIMLSKMLKHNISIIADDNIWNCDGGPPDISFVFTGENRFIPTEVSTSTLTNSF